MMSSVQQLQLILFTILLFYVKAIKTSTKATEAKLQKKKKKKIRGQSSHGKTSNVYLSVSMCNCFS